MSVNKNYFRRVPDTLLATAVICGSTTVYAHHSAAAYDQTTEVVLEGIVKNVVWRNPHMTFTVETMGPDGELIEQAFEGLSVSESVAVGLSRDAIVVGDRVFVRAHPGRRGPGSMALGLELTTGDGSVWPLNVDSSVKTRAAIEAESIEGRWSPSPAEFTATMATLLSWPYNEEARAKLDATWGQPGSTLGYCVDLTLPLLSVFLDLRQIEIVDDSTIRIRFEAQGQFQERIIHMNQDHPADLEPTLLGHSVGRWEGDTLVIDTVGFEYNENGILAHLVSGPSKHVVERMTLSEDRLQLEYELVLDEPELLSEQASLKVRWDHRPDLEPTGVACDREQARTLVEDH